MEVQQCTELTGTNRPCGLTVFTKAIIVAGARSSGVRALASGCSPGCSVTRPALRTASVEAIPIGTPTISGGDIEEAIPDPIPNSEVKLFGADGTAWVTVWESRTLPG